MTDIITTAQNPEHGDINKFRRNFWHFGSTACWRGPSSVSIAPGEKVFFQFHGYIVGFAYFIAHQNYSGPNLQGLNVNKSAIYIAAPYFHFAAPVSLHQDTYNHGWRYVEPTRYSGATMTALRAAVTSALHAKPLYDPTVDYLQPDPDPFSDHIMQYARKVEFPGWRITKSRVRELLPHLPVATQVHKTLSALIEQHDWQEAWVHYVCLLTDDFGGPNRSTPYIRNGGYYYVTGIQAEVLNSSPTTRVDRLRLVQFEGNVYNSVDLFTDMIRFEPDEEEFVKLAVHSPLEDEHWVISNDGNAYEY